MHDQKRNTFHHVVTKMLNILNKDKGLGSKRKGQDTYKGKSIRIRYNFSVKTSKARRAYRDVFQVLKNHRFKPTLIYTAKLSIMIEGGESFP